MTLVVKATDKQTKETEVIGNFENMTLNECINTIRKLDKKLSKLFYYHTYSIKDN